MMNISNKKKINDLQLKKTIKITRLIKCYVCNSHFESQPEFDKHLKLHQSKLNRKSEQINQFKTQQSFKPKKIVEGVPIKTSADFNKVKIEKKTEVKKQVQVKVQIEEQESQQLDQALRESQILLQRIQFMTQIPQSKQQQPQNNNHQIDWTLEPFKKTKNERQLFTIINSLEKQTSSIHKQILETQFENKYYENYQDQLIHLLYLEKLAITEKSQVKIGNIKDKICQDITNDLKQQYASMKTTFKKIKNEIKVTKNTGEVQCCGECYSPIDCSSSFYELACGHHYHLECWQKQKLCCE